MHVPHHDQLDRSSINFNEELATQQLINSMTNIRLLTDFPPKSHTPCTQYQVVDQKEIEFVQQVFVEINLHIDHFLSHPLTHATTMFQKS